MVAPYGTRRMFYSGVIICIIGLAQKAHSSAVLLNSASSQRLRFNESDIGKRNYVDTLKMACDDLDNYYREIMNEIHARLLSNNPEVAVFMPLWKARMQHHISRVRTKIETFEKNPDQELLKDLIIHIITLYHLTEDALRKQFKQNTSLYFSPRTIILDWEDKSDLYQQTSKFVDTELPKLQKLIDEGTMFSSSEVVHKLTQGAADPYMAILIRLQVYHRTEGLRDAIKFYGKNTFNRFAWETTESCLKVWNRCYYEKPIYFYGTLLTLGTIAGLVKAGYLAEWVSKGKDVAEQATYQRTGSYAGDIIMTAMVGGMYTAAQFGTEAWIKALGNLPSSEKIGPFYKIRFSPTRLVDNEWLTELERNSIFPMMMQAARGAQITGHRVWIFNGPKGSGKSKSWQKLLSDMRKEKSNLTMGSGKEPIYIALTEANYKAKEGEENSIQWLYKNAEFFADQGHDVVIIGDEAHQHSEHAKTFLFAEHLNKPSTHQGLIMCIWCTNNIKKLPDDVVDRDQRAIVINMPPTKLAGTKQVLYDHRLDFCESFPLDICDSLAPFMTNQSYDKSGGFFNSLAQIVPPDDRKKMAWDTPDQEKLLITQALARCHYVQPNRPLSKLDRAASAGQLLWHCLRHEQSLLTTWSLTEKDTGWKKTPEHSLIVSAPGPRLIPSRKEDAQKDGDQTEYTPTKGLFLEVNAQEGVIPEHTSQLAQLNSAERIFAGIIAQKELNQEDFEPTELKAAARQLSDLLYNNELNGRDPQSISRQELNAIKDRSSQRFNTYVERITEEVKAHHTVLKEIDRTYQKDGYSLSTAMLALMKKYQPEIEKKRAELKATTAAQAQAGHRAAASGFGAVA